MSQKKSTSKRSSPSTTKARRARISQPQPAVPVVSYENIIEARAAEVVARIDVEGLAPECRTEAHRQKLYRQHVEAQRERFREFEVLGNFYADALAGDDTSAELHNAILAEMDDLSNKSGVLLTSPEVLRLIYPLMRDRLFEKEVGR